MSDFASSTRETVEERQHRRARAKALTAGLRGADYLTDAERTLLQVIRAQGLDVRGGFLDNNGALWRHERVVVKGGRSWSHSKR